VKSGERSKRSGSNWELTVIIAQPTPRQRGAGQIETALSLSGAVGDGQALLLLPKASRARVAAVYAEFEGELDVVRSAQIARSLIYFQDIAKAKVHVVQMREISLPWGRTAWVGVLGFQTSELVPERAVAYFKRVFRSLNAHPVRAAAEIQE
jgi:hypothetical protein